MSSQRTQCPLGCGESIVKHRIPQHLPTCPENPHGPQETLEETS